MEVAVKAYLDMASGEKELITKTAWRGMGVTCVSMQTRILIDFALAILGCVFEIAALACEDFPGKGTQPGLVIAYDWVVETIRFALIMWQVQQPGRWAVWFSTSGVMGWPQVWVGQLLSLPLSSPRLSSRQIVTGGTRSVRDVPMPSSGYIF